MPFSIGPETSEFAPISFAPFRTKFDKDMQSMKGKFGIGCISDYEPQPLIVRSHHGTYAITTVSKINNTDELVEEIFEKGGSHFLEMSGGEINATELIATLINQKENLVDGISYALEKVDGSLCFYSRFYVPTNQTTGRPVRERSLDEHSNNEL
mgnify:CR=1 FL=1